MLERNAEKNGNHLFRDFNMGQARDRIGVVSDPWVAVGEGRRSIETAHYINLHRSTSIYANLHQGGRQRIWVWPSAVRAACRGAQPQNLFGDFEQESHRTPHGFAKDGGFSDGLGNTPSAYRAGREEGELSRAEATFDAVLTGNEGLTRDDHDGFILAIAPLELAGRAIPNDDVRSVVATGGQLVAAGSGIATDYPFGPNRFGPKFDVLRFDHQNWLSHFPQLVSRS